MKQTITFSEPVNIRTGDTFTIAGSYEQVLNPSRRWWQVWKPRKVNGPLRVYTVGQDV